jgi:ribA/ribD-fused uncharacterized protein
MDKITSFSGENFFLSNFYPVEITYEGITYPSVEHAYQAAKTEDDNEKIYISHLKTAAQAKKYGKRLKLRPNWNNLKWQIMVDLVTKKFSVPELKEKLLATGHVDLVEGNNFGDVVWGVCNGVGKNQLGEILMNLRWFYGFSS